MNRTLADRPGTRRKGQPLLVLAAVLIGWVALRIALVSVAVERVGVTQAGPVAACTLPPCRAGNRPKSAGPFGAAQAEDGPLLRVVERWPKDDGAAMDKRKPFRAEPPAGTHALVPARSRAKPNAIVAAPPHWSLGSALAEGVAQGDFAPELPQHQPVNLLPAENLPGAVTGMARSAARRARWSADGWVLLRPSGGPPALATLPAAYGSSQFGAVVRYDLRPTSAVRSQLYLRATGAIGAAFRDRQAALGAAIRPFPKIPVTGLIEGRLQQGTDAVRLRPAVALVSELAPFRLPLGAVGEVYGQAGVVGGRNATGFFDAQATATRKVLNLGSETELDIGAGLWSGGQRGAARLDLGPRVVLKARLGPLPVRASLDWRERAAGNASPGSGPVLTVAAGF